MEDHQPAKSGVLVAGDLVFFGEGNGKFHAVNAATGQMLFTFDGTTVPNGGGAEAGIELYSLCPRCIGAAGGKTTVTKHRDALSMWGKKRWTWQEECKGNVNLLDRVF